jgi:FkbM family methyltransferase
VPGLKQLLDRRDFQQGPVRAIAKRLWWRVRWRFSKKPWIVRMDDGSRIVTHKSGSGALIYYQGASEPETSSFLDRFLKPGMVFVDAGAHVGEYTVRAARLVGPSGQVHAFEPAPETFDILRQSVKLDGYTNVRLNRAALYDADTTVEFRIDEQPTLSSILAENTEGDKETIKVPAMRLDTYWRVASRPIDLVKVDVEGAELDVLHGATGLLARPFWIFEYSSDNYAQQGHQAADVLGAFRDLGYELWRWDGKRASPLNEYELRGITSTNIVAAPRDWQGFA